MYGICGAQCDGCELLKSKKCIGCKASNGCPFGKKCWIAKYIEVGGMDNYNELKNKLIDEINSLNIDGMPKVDNLVPLNGIYINQEYMLPNGTKVKYLNDDENYLGTQVECLFNDDEIKKCFGIVCNPSFILVSEYGEGGTNPELVIYKRR